MCSNRPSQQITAPTPIPRQEAVDPALDASLDRTRQAQTQASKRNPNKRVGAGIGSTIATSSRGAVPLSSSLARTIALGG